MLKHTDIHYLAAILTQIASPWGVEIDLGELIEDVAGGTGRDVDITVRYRLPDGTLAELHGIEVKDEGRALDIAHVEQIAIKLKDMPALTKHALVSSSGFTEPAKRKARHHDLELYHLRDWDGTGLLVDLSECASPQIETFDWEIVNAMPVIDGAEGTVTFDLQSVIHDPVEPQAKRTFGELLDFLCKRVLDDAIAKLGTDEKFDQIEVNTPVKLPAPFQTFASGRLVSIQTIIVQGVIARRVFPTKHARKVLIRDEDNELIAGCLLSEIPDGSLFAFLTSGTEGSLTARILTVTDRGKKKIYKEKMQSIPITGPPPIVSP